MIKYFIIVIVMSTFIMAKDNNINTEKPTPTITTSDDSEKTFARRRGGKGNKGRKRGGSGLR